MGTEDLGCSWARLSFTSDDRRWGARELKRKATQTDLYGRAAARTFILIKSFTYKRGITASYLS